MNNWYSRVREEMNNIPGFPGYSITKDGGVWSSKTYRFLKTNTGTNGYKYLVLRRNGRSVTSYIHRLVALTFIGPRPEGLEIRHLNGNRDDNRIENIRYGTRSENRQDSRKHGTLCFGEKQGCSKLTWQQVLDIRAAYSTGRWTQIRIARAYGVSRQHVCDIVNYKKWAWLEG